MQRILAHSRQLGKSPSTVRSIGRAERRDILLLAQKTETLGRSGARSRTPSPRSESRRARLLAF